MGLQSLDQVETEWSHRTRLSSARCDVMVPPQPSLFYNTKPAVQKYFSRPLYLWLPRELASSCFRSTMLPSRNGTSKCLYVLSDLYSSFSFQSFIMLCRTLYVWACLEVVSFNLWPCYTCSVLILSILESGSAGHCFAGEDRRVLPKHMLQYVSVCRVSHSASVLHQTIVLDNTNIIGHLS